MSTELLKRKYKMSKEEIKLINDIVSSVVCCIVDFKPVGQMTKHLEGMGVPKEIVDHCGIVAALGQNTIDDNM